MASALAPPPPPHPPRGEDDGGSPSFLAVDASPRLRPAAAAAAKAALSLPATVREEAHEDDAVTPPFLAGVDASHHHRPRGSNATNHHHPRPALGLHPSRSSSPPSTPSAHQSGGGGAPPHVRGGGGTTRGAWSLPATVRGGMPPLDDARTRSLFCAALFPVAATVTTDVWYQSAPPLLLLSSYRPAMGYDVVLALTNVSGAFLDGFFQAWETGVAVPIGAGTEALRVVADDFRSYYLSTYTSWAGMVGVAASLANARSSVSIGMAYIVISILMAFVAHGLGSDVAKRISSTAPMANEAYVKPYARRANELLKNFMIFLVGYVLLPYVYLGGGILEDPDDKDEDINRFWITATPRNQLAVSSIFAVMGAYVGHELATSISMSTRHPLIPMETLICNGLFGLMGLTLNMMKLRDRSWGDSLLMRGFAINFCGAASLFARHASDNRRLFAKKKGGHRRAAINMCANVLLAMVIFWIALEIEEWTHPDTHRRGVVMRIMKILERREETQQQDQ